MGKTRLAKCWHCGQMRSLEWGPGTLCGNCGHQITPGRRGCQCQPCQTKRLEGTQQELFDLATGKPLVPAEDERAGARKQRKGAPRD